MKKLLVIALIILTSSVFADCPEGTWSRDQYTGPGGGLYTGPGGGMYTGPGGGLYTGPGGGLYTGPGSYCTNRPPLRMLIRMGVIDNYGNLI